MLRQRGLSENRSCALSVIGRSSYRYTSRPRRDEALAERLRAYSRRHGREGYRKAHAYLREKGVVVNHKRVERLWRLEGLSVRKKPRQRRRGKSVDPIPQRAKKPNQVWTCDFMEDSCVHGRKLRFLNVVDEHTREALACIVSRSFPAERVVQEFARLAEEHGMPEFVRSDNGTEFVAKAMERWRKDMQVGSIFIDPGKPWQNGFGESFNSRMREECLNMEVFYGVRDAQATVERWRRYYNEERPHGALGYRSPLAFKRQWLAEQEALAKAEDPGALPPDPRDLPLECSKQKSHVQETATGGATPDAARAASRSATALGSLPSGALSSARTTSAYEAQENPATKTLEPGESSHFDLS